MSKQRKHYLIDRSIQVTIASKILVIPLILLTFFSLILLFFVYQNSNYITQISGNQENLIEMFMTTPALMDKNNEIVVTGEKTFRENLGILQSIKDNNLILLYCAIGITIFQAVLLFIYGVYLTHKIAGPIYVMRQYCKEIQQGKAPQFRQLRKGDLLIDFYGDFVKAITTLQSKK
jgi:nitrogen fixation/metabolism regulation signal transduction histidine kinase